MVAGAGTAAALGLQERPLDLALEVLGGAIGGRLLSRLPDILDPPNSPRHRGIGHGILPAGGSSLFYMSKLPLMQSRLRELADDHAATDPLLAVLLRVAAGVVAGALGGFASHLLLDAQTPAGLPWIA